MWRGAAVYTDEERDVLEYAEQMTRTPVSVDDRLFARLRARYDHAQLVELTACIAWENFRARFDHAFGVESQEFSQGAVCAVPAATERHAP